MYSIITELAAETKSIRSMMAGFQAKVEEAEQWIRAVEDRLKTVLDRDQELTLCYCHAASELLCTYLHGIRRNPQTHGFLSVDG
ncbi:hypothetical protein NDU88_002588 [Pleurodeles waltl]|uniref:LXG domain-containing protein n=1 Tax=Pleurodeles waltl TaxID=8319 RepID=A0AAV7W3I0_PLEWA|nr:hypothetical protein NDU88_002588 [Pleurodeles waltl]